MSWSFYLIEAAAKVATEARTYSEAGQKLPDEKEEAARKNALEIVALVADAHDPAQILRVESHGSMSRMNDDPAKYSLKILVEPHAAG